MFFVPLLDTMVSSWGCTTMRALEHAVYLLFSAAILSWSERNDNYDMVVNFQKFKSYRVERQTHKQTLLRTIPPSPRVVTRKPSWRKGKRAIVRQTGCKVMVTLDIQDSRQPPSWILKFQSCTIRSVDPQNPIYRTKHHVSSLYTTGVMLV